MYKEKTILQKLICSLLILIMTIGYFPINAFATDISEANMYSDHECGHHLQFWNAERNAWSYVTTTFVVYNYNGREYPCYCLNREKEGVSTDFSYTVNINSVLDREDIWRTIIHGYPYASASSLGVANDDDAFVATKHAVYSVLYGIDVDNYYRGGDARGDQIMNAIRYLVNEGRNGSARRTDPNVTLNRVGTFKLDTDNNYYSQEYSVSTNVASSEYTVTDILGFPSGTIVTDMGNNQTSTFSADSHFKVLVPVSALENEISGTIVANARCKSYPIFYGNSPSPDLQNYAVTFDPYSVSGGRSSFNARVTGMAGIKKVEYGNESNCLAGAKYDIYKDLNNNKQIDEGEPIVLTTEGTDSNGDLSFSLGLGNYIAKESVAPEGYNLSPYEYPFSFTPYNLNTEIKDKDIIITGGLNITKTDREDSTKRLNGAEYNIYKDSNGNKKYDEGEEFVVRTGATDDNGIVSVPNLRYGNYVALECVAPQYYDLDKDHIAFKVEKQGEIVNIIAKDIASRGNVEIHKTSEDGKNIEGIQFRIKGTSFLGDEVDEIITTDKDGKAILENIKIGDNFTAEEINVPEGYVKPENQTFNITANQSTELNFYNAIIKGKIKLEKKSADNSDLTGFEAGTPLPGTEYTIYDKDMNILQVVTTGEDGTVTTDYINYGKVYIKETKAPDYYLIDDAVHEMFIKNNEVVEFFAHTDESVKIKVNVYKQGIKQTTCGQEIRYDFSNIENNSNVPLSNFYWIDNLPSEVRINSLFTGTYNEELEYTISYKTNLNDWKEIDKKYSTKTNNYVDFKSIELAEDEYITDYRLNFGTTQPGFKEEEKPFILVRVNDGLSKDTIFTNFTTVGGTYLEKEVTESSKWSTCLYEKQLKVKKLPRTGF